MKFLWEFSLFLQLNLIHYANGCSATTFRNHQQTISRMTQVVPLSLSLMVNIYERSCFKNCRTFSFMWLFWLAGEENGIKIFTSFLLSTLCVNILSNVRWFSICKVYCACAIMMMLLCIIKKDWILCVRKLL